MSTRLELASIVSLALALGGCCEGVEDEVYTRTYEETLMAEQLDEVRMGMQTDEQRCETACMLIINGGDTDGPTDGSDTADIKTCTATPADDSLPTWDIGQAEVTVRCQTERIEPGFCTGRRELGDWLARHDAPPDLIARRRIEAAQRRALAKLGRDAAHDAARTPAGLGCPTPAEATQLAASFAALIERELDCAA